MTLPHQLVADLLAGTLPPDVVVEPYARNLEAITRPTLMLRLDEVDRYAGAPAAARRYRFALVVLVPVTEPGTADDALEALLEDALFAVESTPDLEWSSAKRALWIDETTPAFEVSLDVPVTK